MLQNSILALSRNSAMLSRIQAKIANKNANETPVMTQQTTKEEKKHEEHPDDRTTYHEVKHPNMMSEVNDEDGGCFFNCWSWLDSNYLTPCLIYKHKRAMKRANFEFEDVLKEYEDIQKEMNDEETVDDDFQIVQTEIAS